MNVDERLDAILKTWDDCLKVVRKDKCTCDNPYEYFGTDEHIFCGNCGGVITYREIINNKGGKMAKIASSFEEAEAIFKGENLMFYGPHGASKSTIASSFPDVCFLAGEPGIKYLNIPEKAKNYIKSWESMEAFVARLADPEAGHGFKWVAIDTGDAFNIMATDKVCAESDVTTLMDTPRKVGYDTVRQMLNRILKPLTMSTEIGVILLMHAKRVQCEDRTGRQWDKYDLNVTDKTKEMLLTEFHHIFYVGIDDEGERIKRVIHTHQSMEHISRSWNPVVSSKIKIDVPNIEPNGDTRPIYEAIINSAI